MLQSEVSLERLELVISIKKLLTQLQIFLQFIVHFMTYNDQGIEIAIIEASSHALLQERLEGLSFIQGIFTNLTQDHLDYHKTMEKYREAKGKLFNKGFTK